MTKELTPAVQDAAYRLGWAMARAGMPLFCPDEYGQPEIALGKSVFNLSAGFDAFTPEAEAERVEAVREASIEPLTPNRLWANLREALMIFAALYVVGAAVMFFMP